MSELKKEMTDRERTALLAEALADAVTQVVCTGELRIPDGIVEKLSLKSDASLDEQLAAALRGRYMQEKGGEIGARTDIARLMTHLHPVQGNQLNLRARTQHLALELLGKGFAQGEEETRMENVDATIEGMVKDELCSKEAGEERARRFQEMIDSGQVNDFPRTSKEEPEE